MINKNTQDYTLEKDFDKKFTNFLKNDLTKINHVQEKLKKGLSASYTDDKGRLIEEHPDGRKFVVKYNKDTDEFDKIEELK